MTDRDWLERAAATPAIGRTARRYAAFGRFNRHYVASKLKRDPVHRDVLRRAGPEGYGEVIDLGCGRGQMGVLLLEAGVARAVTGLDRPDGPIAVARLAGAGLPYAAHAQDLVQDPNVPACDTVLLIDVLYQLGPDPARRLLSRAASAARRRLLIRTLDPALGWRSRLAMTMEQLGRLGWPHSGRRVAPLPLSALCSMLRELGFEVEVSPSWQGTPFANVLVDARRPKPQGPYPG